MAWTVWTVCTVRGSSSDAAGGVPRAVARVRSADTAGNRSLSAAQWHRRLAITCSQLRRIHDLFTAPAAQKQIT